MSDTPRTDELKRAIWRLMQSQEREQAYAWRDAIHCGIEQLERALTAERERAERLMERLQQESERCDKEISQRIWADAELQRERERADRNQEDAERLDWMDKSAFTAYRDRDPEYGELYDFATVVNEDRKGDRVGEVFKTIREAIDAARRK